MCNEYNNNIKIKVNLNNNNKYWRIANIYSDNGIHESVGPASIVGRTT